MNDTVMPDAITTALVIRAFVASLARWWYQGEPVGARTAQRWASPGIYIAYSGMAEDARFELARGCPNTLSKSAIRGQPSSPWTWRHEALAKRWRTVPYGGE